MVNRMEGAPTSSGRGAAKKVLKVTGIVLAIGLVAGGAFIGRFAYNNLETYDRFAAKVEKAGFVEKQAVIDGVTLNYAEGPANGQPPLLIIPGQGSDWKSYGEVLPDLADEVHVYAIDPHGHGRSDRAPDRYKARLIADDLHRFLIEVIGEPTIVVGHSSGGQLAALLGANAPHQVSAVLLEDPPMFTTLLPRALNTWNYRDLATSTHNYLEENPDYPDNSADLPASLWEHQLMWKYFGDGAKNLQAAGVKQRAEHPDRPIKVWWFPGADYQRSLTMYDPRFGDAFYTGAWNDGFDHEETLRSIEQPTTYMHAKVDYDGEILRGAADDDDAARSMALLPNATFVQTDTGHGIHNDDPKLFVDELLKLKARVP